jgi:uncharacterized Tic20 family protein
MDYLKTAWETLKPILTVGLMSIVAFTLIYGSFYFLGRENTAIVAISLIGALFIIAFIDYVIHRTKLNRKYGY